MDFPAPPAVVEASSSGPNTAFTAILSSRNRSGRPSSAGSRPRLGWPVEKGWLLRAPGVVSSAVPLRQGVHQSRRGRDCPDARVFSILRRGRNERPTPRPESPEVRRRTDSSMDFEDLERQIDSRTRMLILCSPHNPVGRVWTRDELERLGRICRGQRDPHRLGRNPRRTRLRRPPPYSDGLSLRRPGLAGPSLYSLRARRSTLPA